MNERLKLLGPGSATDAVDRLEEVEEAVRAAVRANHPRLPEPRPVADEEATLTFEKDGDGRYALVFRMVTLDHERAFAAVAAAKSFLQPKSAGLDEDR